MTQSLAQQFQPLIEQLDSHAEDVRRFQIRFWDTSLLPAQSGDGDAPELQIRHPQALARMIHAPGELGLGRAWVAGELGVAGDNQELEKMLQRLEEWKPGAPHLDALPAAWRALRRTGALKPQRIPPPETEIVLDGRLHSIGRDRRAIRYHYDVSNQFYRLMLGSTMVYSCAYFKNRSEDLDLAQTRKLDLVCQKLDLQPGEHFLDIGCGWGSLVVHAARNYGVQAVGVTLSERQAAWARDWIAREGLESRCNVRVQDYREIQDGPYHKIASVGMFEHVGKRNLWLYLSQARGLLLGGGLFLNHGIVRTNQVKNSRRTFSKRFVFPDGELQTQGSIIKHFEGAGFELLDDESLRPHYAQTLRCWADRIQQRRNEVIAEIGEERERIWRLHNVGAALAFQEERLSVHQALLRGMGDGEERLPRIRPAYRED